jgi:hypothetical protein
VEKLKSSLDDAMSAHKKAMDDNEKLLTDLKKANNSIRVCSVVSFMWGGVGCEGLNFGKPRFCNFLLLASHIGLNLMEKHI